MSEWGACGSCCIGAFVCESIERSTRAKAAEMHTLEMVQRDLVGVRLRRRQRSTEHYGRDGSLSDNRTTRTHAHTHTRTRTHAQTDRSGVLCKDSLLLLDKVTDLPVLLNHLDEAHEFTNVVDVGG